MNQVDILETFYKIATANNWHHHHTPRNLAAAVSVEAAELLAEFQWLSEAEVAELPSQPENLKKIRHEMADVAIYLMVLADKLGVDLDLAIQEKSQENAQRFCPGDKK